MPALFLLLAWIGTWAAAPAWSDASSSFEDDTLREVVHVSIGGDAARVRFTNRFGEAPLVIAHATIALAQHGSAVPIAGTLHELTFQGGRSATLPPRADIVSDAVALHVPPQSDLLISLYVPGPTGPSTYHPSAYQTNYYAQGDRASETTAGGFSQTYVSWYFLGGVDVLDSSARGAVVALGDSITDGQGSTKNSNDRWPDILARRLSSEPQSEQLGVLNAGIGGNRILQGGGPFGINALARLDADVLSQSGVTGVIVLLGINDIQQNPHQYDATRIELGLQQIALQAHTRGLRVIVCTIVPYEGWGSYEPQGEQTRLAVNKFIRHSRAFDAFADFDAAIADPTNPHRMQARYDSGDHLHPSAAGYRAMAGSIDLSRL